MLSNSLLVLLIQTVLPVVKSRRAMTVPAHCSEDPLFGLGLEFRVKDYDSVCSE